MEKRFEGLCAQLEDKVTRQEKAIEICRAQRAALRTHDYEYVGAKTVEFASLLQESQHHENALHLNLQKIYDHFNLGASERNLGSLIDFAPFPFSDRIAKSEQMLHLLHIELVSLTHSSVLTMQNAAETISECMLTLHDCLSTEIETTENIVPLERRPALRKVS